MDYQKNRIAILLAIGVVVLAAAIYYFMLFTSDKQVKVEPIDIDIPFSIELSGPFDYSTYALPVGYSKYQEALNDISLFAEIDGSLSRLPKKIENIVFNADGMIAMVFESDKVSFYDVQSNSLTEIPALVGGWGSGFFKNSNFLKIGYDEPTKKDTLQIINLETFKVEDLIYFIRDIQKYELIGSENVMFMVDKTNQPNILYKIDEDSRTNILEADFIKLADVSDDFLAIEKGDNQFNTTLNIYDTQAKNFTELPYEIMAHNIKFQDNYAYFVSDSEKGENTYNIEELLSSQANPQTIALFKWDLYAQTYDQVELDLPALPDRIEVQGDIVRMLVGEEYYDAELI